MIIKCNEWHSLVPGLQHSFPGYKDTLRITEYEIYSEYYCINGRFLRCDDGILAM